MAAPSYAQAMLDTHVRYPQSRHYGLGIDSEGDEHSSVADISTVVTYSDTDEGDSPRRRRDFVSSLKSRLRRSGAGGPSNAEEHHNESPLRRSRHATFDDLSPVPSSPSRVSVNGYASSDMDVVGSSHSRAGSIYSLSRISFASRLAQLMSIPLPTASSLSARISSQPTAHLAARSLTEAGEQIKMWTKKASDVLQDLDAQDDVEWSSAGGREGLEEVDQAITRFEGLVKVYVICIEELQMRSDVRTLSDETLRSHANQMEGVVVEWSKIKQSLKGVKEQVEVALEWEELWNTVLGEIAQELNALGELIFEMEEKRHQTVAATPSKTNQVDIDELADIVEGNASTKSNTMKAKLALPPPFSPTSPLEAPSSGGNKDDAVLFGLFARMQPLRASLDFLPIKLSLFHTRGNALFPSGCIELESRRDSLEAQWKKLEADAEALRKELGEDRWLLVFRNAGNQALKMFESVERSQAKLSQALSTGLYDTDKVGFVKMIESFEAKKTHYVPAIDRVLGLIDRGVLDRLTVNGEILRLQSDMKRRRSSLEASISDLDYILEKGSSESSGRHMRDSILSIVSSDKSRPNSTVDTPHSSPASSIMMRSRNSSVTSRTTPTAASSSKYGGSRRTSNLGSVTPSVRSRVSDVHRNVTAPLPPVAEPYVGKKNELFRDFKQPANKPRWSSGGANLLHREPVVAPAAEPALIATPRKYTPSRISQLTGSLLSGRGAPSPSPDNAKTPASVRRISSAQHLPPRSTSALEFRSTSASATMSPYKQRMASSSQMRQPSTPLTARKSMLPTLIDEEDGQGTPSKLPRPRQSLSRPPSAMSTSRPSAASSLTVSKQRRGSLASTTTTATPGARRTSNILPSQGLAVRNGGRDSRAGMRSASAMGMISNDGTQERPAWRY